MASLPFERHPREHSEAYEAFLVFRDLGRGRSLRAVQRRLGGSRCTLKKWSATFHWTARVAAYTAHLAGVELAAKEKALRQHVADWGKRQTALREEEWALHDECLRAGRAALARFAAQDNAVTLAETARILELASKLGRLAAGLATDQTEVANAHPQFLIQIDAALDKVYGVAAPPAHREPTPAPIIDVAAIQK